MILGSFLFFTGLVADRSRAESRSIAIRCCLAIAVILVATVWIGEFLLTLFGVGIPSLQVAGGLIITLISLSMLQSRRSGIHDTKGKDSAEASTDQPDIAIVPLAMPMVAGPGAMVTVIVNTHQHNGIAANIEMSIVCVILAAVICVGFLAAGPMMRILGTKKMDLVTKFMGMILLAIAAGMLAAGLKGLLPGLAGVPAS